MHPPPGCVHERTGWQSEKLASYDGVRSPQKRFRHSPGKAWPVPDLTPVPVDASTALQIANGPKVTPARRARRLLSLRRLWLSLFHSMLLPPLLELVLLLGC